MIHWRIGVLLGCCCCRRKHNAADPALTGLRSLRRPSSVRGFGEVAHGYCRITVLKLDCSCKKSSLKAMFAPTFRMWLEGREDEMVVIQTPQTLTPMYVPGPVIVVFGRGCWSMQLIALQRHAGSHRQGVSLVIESSVLLLLWAV
jgi:hypothetical protein